MQNFIYIHIHIYVYISNGSISCHFIIKKKQVGTIIKAHTPSECQ